MRMSQQTVSTGQNQSLTYALSLALEEAFLCTLVLMLPIGCATTEAASTEDVRPSTTVPSGTSRASTRSQDMVYCPEYGGWPLCPSSAHGATAGGPFHPDSYDIDVNQVRFDWQPSGIQAVWVNLGSMRDSPMDAWMEGKIVDLRVLEGDLILVFMVRVPLNDGSLAFRRIGYGLERKRLRKMPITQPTKSEFQAIQQLQQTASSERPAE